MKKYARVYEFVIQRGGVTVEKGDLFSKRDRFGDCVLNDLPGAI